MKKNKILFVNTHFIPDYHFGGVVESGSKLFKYLEKIDSSFYLVTVSKDPKEVIPYLKSKGVCYKSLGLHRYAFSVNLIFGLWAKVKDSNVLFINGTVTFPTVLAQIYAIMLDKPFIVSIRGTFGKQSIKQKKWKKYFYYNYLLVPLLKRANKIHVTSRNEERLTKIRGVKKTFLVSNGIDIEQYVELPEKFEFNESNLDLKNKFVFLFMSRMDKEKGLDLLFEAYKMFVKENPNKDTVLLLVGPDNQNYLKSLNLNFNGNNIKYIPGIYGNDKLKVIRRADVVILPSYNENFGNIVAEAFACERPVITTTGTPWKAIEVVGCGYYIEPKVDELVQAMEKVYLLPQGERKKMGRIGRKYIFDNFDWQIKANEIYENLVDLV